MSGSASTTLEQHLLDHSLAIAPMPVLQRVYVALCLAATPPTDALAGEEVSGGGYVRTAATFARLASNIATNSATIEFPAATADWGAIGYFEIWDQSLAGTRLYWGPLVFPTDGETPLAIAISAGDIARFSAGTLLVQFVETPEEAEVAGFLPLSGGQMTGPITFTTNTPIGLDNAAYGGDPNMFLRSDGGAFVFHAGGWDEYTPTAFRGINFKVWGNAGADEYWGVTGGPEGNGAALKVYSVSGGWPCIGSILASNEGQLMLGNDNGTILNLQGTTGVLNRNYLRITGSGASVPVILSSVSSDTDGHIQLQAKAAGNVYLGNTNYTGVALATLQVGGTAVAQVNGFRMAGTATGAAPVLSAVGNDTNIDFVVAPKGTGALRATNLGDARGAHAIDWQKIRATNAQVASGGQSVIAGGSSNVASGVYSVVSGGYLNNADGDYSTVMGGMRAWARGQQGWLGWASGIVQGIQEGDAQGSWRILMGATSGSTAVRLTSDRLAINAVAPGVNSVLLGNDRAIAMTIMLVGMDRTATGTAANMYFNDILVAKKASGGNYIQLGTPRTLGTSNPTVSITIGANQLLDVTVTPANANSWHFVAKLSCVEML